MGLEEWKRILQDHLWWVIALSLSSGGFAWVIASHFFEERIATLKEKEAVLVQHNKFLETKLKEPAGFGVSVPAMSSPHDKPMGNTDGASVTPPPTLRYPPISNVNQLSKSDVRNLAQFYDLFNEWKVNPHLRFKEGDISYWQEQGLSENALKLEFESRRLVLQQAESSRQRIATQGDLSHRAQELQSKMIRQ